MFAQKTTILKGTVKNKDKKAIENVSVEFGLKGTVTDKEGNLPPNIEFAGMLAIADWAHKHPSDKVFINNYSREYSYNGFNSPSK